MEPPRWISWQALSQYISVEAEQFDRRLSPSRMCFALSRSDDAIWYFLNTIFAMADFEHGFRSSVVISVGSEPWASAIRAALSDPRSFSARALATSDV